MRQSRSRRRSRPGNARQGVEQASTLSSKAPICVRGCLRSCAIFIIPNIASAAARSPIPTAPLPPSSQPPRRKTAIWTCSTFAPRSSNCPTDQREALILIGASGLSYEEAAGVCGCAVGTMKSRVNRARSRLSICSSIKSGMRFRRTMATGKRSSPARGQRFSRGGSD